MPKITFMGAGSTVFAKNVLGDSMMTPALAEKIWNTMTHRSELVTRLTRLYTQTINDLMGANETEEEEPENPTWR